MIEILIPTCKPDVTELEAAIRKYSPGAAIIASCRSGSAAYNRNWCLGHAVDELAIMIDDDISGFYPGWHWDLFAPLVDPQVAIVTARLMRPDGRVGPTCSRCYDLSPETIDIEPDEHCVLPTAAIAFRNIGIRFDENFRGSGFEDGDWCFEYRKRWPTCRFVQSNKCRLVHRNEMKAQRENWNHNKAYFESKWKQQPICR